MAESCTYGGILSFKTTQYEGCGFGDILSFTTLDEEIFPTDTLARVTSLVHRWTPGEYLLEVGLGEVVSEFILTDIGPPYTRGVGGGGEDGDGGKEPPNLIQGPCHPGEGRCFGNHWYVCKKYPATFEITETHWTLTQKNSDYCKGEW